jgi:hypothetical protein
VGVIGVGTQKVTTEYRLSQWAQVIKAKADSGQSIKEFCHLAGISRNSYFYWQQKLRKAACEQLSAPGFAKVIVQTLPTLPALPEAALPSQLCIEIAGARITADSGYPPEKLAALLRELTRPC